MNFIDKVCEEAYAIIRTIVKSESPSPPALMFRTPAGECGIGFMVGDILAAEVAAISKIHNEEVTEIAVLGCRWSEGENQHTTYKSFISILHYDGEEWRVGVVEFDKESGETKDVDWDNKFWTKFITGERMIAECQAESHGYDMHDEICKTDTIDDLRDTIKDKLVDILKEKGYNDEQIEEVMEKAKDLSAQIRNNILGHVKGSSEEDEDEDEESVDGDWDDLIANRDNTSNDPVTSVKTIGTMPGSPVDMEQIKKKMDNYVKTQRPNCILPSRLLEVSTQNKAWTEEERLHIESGCKSCAVLKLTKAWKEQFGDSSEPPKK